MPPSLSFDAAYKTLPNKVFSFKANQLEVFDDSEWPPGAKIGASNRVSDELLWTIPQDCVKPALVSHIVTSWYNDCKHVFVKPLNIDNLISIAEHIVDKSYPVLALSPEEETQEWILLWTVTRIEIAKSLLNIYWAPTHKRICESRIIEDFEIEEGPEDYKIIDANIEFPLADGPALRLEAELDQGQERFRRRIRDARLRAKLSKYRSEKLALQFQKKYGYYPVEDEEEAQTEYESNTDDDSSS